MIIVLFARGGFLRWVHPPWLVFRRARAWLGEWLDGGLAGAICCRNNGLVSTNR